MNCLSTPLALLASITVASSAFAGAMNVATPASSKFYIGIGMGAIFSNSSNSFTATSNSVLYSPTAIGTSLFTLNDINWQNKFSNGFDFNAVVGHQLFSSNRFDFEFLYQNIQRDSLGTYGWREQYSTTGAIYAQQANNKISQIAGRATTYSFLTNISHDFNNFGKWQPLIGAGVGVAWLRAGSIQTDNSINIDDPNTPLVETAPAIQTSPSLYGTAFAWQFKVGVGYQVSEMAIATLQYRLYGTTEFKGSSSSIVTSPGTLGQANFYVGEHDINPLLIHAIELNMRFNI